MTGLRTSDGALSGRRDAPDGHAAPDAGAVRAAWTAAALLCMVATFHAALVVGAPWGEYTQGGRASGTLATSARVVAAVSSVMTVLMSGAILARVGHGVLTHLPSRARTTLAWFTLLYAVLAVILNLMTRSPAERTVWAPVSIALLALIAFVMAPTHRQHRRHTR